MPSSVEIKPHRIQTQMVPGSRKNLPEKLSLTTRASEGLIGYDGEVVEPAYKEWVSLKPDSIALDPSVRPSGEVEVTVIVPKNAEYRKHEFAVQFTDDQKPPSEAKVEIEVDVQPAWRIWLQENRELVLGLLIAFVIILVIVLITNWPGSS